MTLSNPSRGTIDPATADGVIQDVFQAVSVSLEDLRRDRPGDSFRGWLKGITRHRLLAWSRRENKRQVAAGGTAHLNNLQQQAMQADDSQAPELDEPAEQISNLYHRACHLVKAEFSDVAWLCFWRLAIDGQKSTAVAQELGMTPAAVRMARSRVLRRLREEVGDVV